MTTCRTSVPFVRVTSRTIDESAMIASRNVEPSYSTFTVPVIARRPGLRIVGSPPTCGPSFNALSTLREKFFTVARAEPVTDASVVVVAAVKVPPA